MSFLPILPILLAAQTQAQDSTHRLNADSARTTGKAQSLIPMNVRADASARRTGYRATVTSSATRTPTPLREIPQSITSMPAPLLRDLNLTTMAKVVEYVPGVVMGQGEGHRDAPTIRGQSTTADFFVDGVRDDAQYLRDTYNVAQLDALKGPNAAIFGRGGGGGVINRNIKQADFTTTRSGRVETGSWNQRRVTLDVGQKLTRSVAGRVNLLHEGGSAFRREADFERNGINPTLAVIAGPVLLTMGAEHFTDRRTIDRGLPSANGAPADLDARAYVGNARISPSRLTANSGWLVGTWNNGHGVTVKSHTRAFSYDKFYQNVFASGAVNATGQFNLGAYNSTHDRRSLFNQTDVMWQTSSGPVRQTLLVGTELSRQQTENIRNTGYFNNTATSLTVAASAPTTAAPVTFRPSATDANNRTTTTVAAAFVQEQLHLGSHVQLLGGVRHDRFAMDYLDHRSRATLQRIDNLLSPRGAVVLTPVQPLSLYGSLSLSFLPSAGDQFGALTATTQTLAPEQFRNRELGLKWAMRPALDVTAAWFALDRSNTTAPDPVDATRLVQTGRQQTRGAEFGVQGAVNARWDIMGGLALQRARIVSRTSAARLGASVPLVPHTTASLWNKVRVARSTAVSLGIVHQGQRYAAIDNAVRLPHFTRLDGGLFLTLPRGIGAQLQVENLLDTRYTATSHGNNNIMPGAGRTLRLQLSY